MSTASKSPRDWVVVLDGHHADGTATYVGELDAGLRQGVKRLTNASRFTKAGARRVLAGYPSDATAGRAYTVQLTRSELAACSKCSHATKKTPAELDRDIAAAVGPGPKPKDPREISFDPRCFVEVGTQTEYVVAPLRGSTSYPARLTDRRAAEALAKRTGRTMREESVPIRKRISWK
jgi:hypothetical protein